MKAGRGRWHLVAFNRWRGTKVLPEFNPSAIFGNQLECDAWIQAVPRGFNCIHPIGIAAVNPLIKAGLLGGSCEV